jgi:hypothetical protein
MGRPTKALVVTMSQALSMTGSLLTVIVIVTAMGCVDALVGCGVGCEMGRCEGCFDGRGVGATVLSQLAAPVLVPNWPGGHFTHSDCPRAAWNHPTAQLVQIPDPGTAAYVPAAQPAHCDDDVEPGPDWYLPAEQAVHAPAPTPDWYIPATHAVQSCDINEPVSAR